MLIASGLGAGTAASTRRQSLIGNASSLAHFPPFTNKLEGLSMSNTEEVVLSRIRVVRERYLLAVVAWRRERDVAEAKLRAAEHELAQSLAQFVARPKSGSLAPG
jgi:hypothetical protein